MGAIISVLLAAALPEYVTRLALIDGIVPFTAEAQESLSLNCGATFRRAPNAETSA